MTKTHYEVIASLIVKAKEFHPEATEGLEALTMMLTGAFLQDSPRFRQDIFLAKAEHPSLLTHSELCDALIAQRKAKA